MHRDGADRREVLVRLGREVVPDVAGDGVGRERAAGVGVEQREGHAELVRQVVAVEEVVGEHDLPHLLLVLVGLGPLPVPGPAGEIAGSGAAAGVDADRRLGRLARVAAGAPLGERDLAAPEEGLVPGQMGRAAGRVLQAMGSRRPEEEERQAGRLRLGGEPVGGVLPGDPDLDRRDRLPADEGLEVQEPLLAEQADVQVHAIEGPQGADRVRAVLQDARGQDGVGLLEELGQRAGLDVVVELAVVEPPARERLLPPALADLEARAQLVDRVHGARVVDVVGRHERGVEGPRPRRVEELEHVVRPVVLPAEDPVDPEVLGADVGGEVLPLGVLRVGGRPDGARPDVAERARHADAVGPHQVLRVVVLRVGVVAHGVPLLGRRLVEVGIREQPEADDPRRLPVVGAHRHAPAPGSDPDARVPLLVLEGVGRTVRAPLVEPQAVALGIRAGRLVEAGLVDQAEILPARAPVEVLHALVRVGREDLEEVEEAEAGDGDHVPEAVVPARPHEPGVAPLDLLPGQAAAAVHVVEVVLGGGRERGGRPARPAGLVEDLARPWPVLPASSSEEEKEGAQWQEGPQPAHAVVGHEGLLVAQSTVPGGPAARSVPGHGSRRPPRLAHPRRDHHGLRRRDSPRR